MPRMPWHSIGVDWDSGSWIAVGFSDDGRADAEKYESIDTLWETHEEQARRIVVDVPIGLCGADEPPAKRLESEEELSRACDDLARTVLGPRSSSVFTAPCRAAAKIAGEEPYSTVNQTNKDHTGKGLMRQAANIAPGIVAVEDLLLDGDGDPDVLLEGHPELCFRAMSNGPLQYNKRTAPGLHERLKCLEGLPAYERGTWRRLAASLHDAGHDTGTDDLIDALGLALTAQAPAEELHFLPSENPPTDAENLPMQMVYRRSEPFPIA